MNLDDLPRRKVRYWLFRFRTELEEDGANADDAPEGLREHFEGLEWFQGWGKFGFTWDVHEEDKFRIVPLHASLHDQWNKTIEEKVPELVKVETHNDKITKKKKASKKKAKKK